jgi:ribokinase
MSLTSKRKDRTPRIVVLGGINTDYVVRSKKLPEAGQTVQGEDVFIGPGGKGANQAVAAARLGAKVALIGRVGDEPRGRELLRGLRREGIDARHVCLEAKRPSGAAIIAVDASGEKQISSALGANCTLEVKKVREAEELIAGADVLLIQFETPMTCVLAAARLARKHGVKVVLDPAPPTRMPKELFPLLYAIRPNADEAEQITGVCVKNRVSAGKAAKALLRKGVKIAAVQAGRGGDLVVSKEEEIFVPRMKVKVVDATGAGDAFAAALAVGIAEEMTLRDAARLANATAALSTTKMGAQAGMPRRAEVNRVLTR